MRPIKEIEEIILSVITPHQVNTLNEQFAIDFMGVHGLPHWLRVAFNGLYLSAETGADPKVLILFAFFHDCRRLNEYTDPQHGERGGLYYREVFHDVFGLTTEQDRLLFEACKGHTDVRYSDDPTIGTAYDSDRLDLRRVGIVPDNRYLSTEYAKDPEVQQWANRDMCSYMNTPMDIIRRLI